MKSIRDILNTRQSKKTVSERAELIGFFHEKLRDQRGKPYRIQFIGMKLSPFSLEDLYYLKSKCIEIEARGGSFSKTFWGSLKIR